MRSRYFGTFLLNSISSRHGRTTQAVSPISTTFFYSPVEPDGRMSIQIFFDHRIMDGASAGRLLAELNAFLCEDIVAELDALD
jgi:pyruvate/2-oxoglutarate dehydrogenase complex dihydrolipoamide acyltransferase (E2) component